MVVASQKDKKIKEAEGEKEINTGGCEIRIVVKELKTSSPVILSSES